MTAAQIPNFVALPGLASAISSAGYPIQSIMQPDQITQVWYTDDSVLSQVQALIAAYDPMPATRQPFLAELIGIYSAKIAAGFTYAGHVYQLGPDALGSTGVFNLNSIAALAQQALGGDTTAWPAGSYIRDAANVNVAVNPATALAIAKGAGEYVVRLRKNYWAIQAQINAAANAAALQAIDLNSGWS